MKFSEISRNILKSNMLIILLLSIGGVFMALSGRSLLCTFVSAIYYIFLGVIFTDYLFRHIVVRRQRICAFVSACLIVLLFVIRILKYKFFIESTDAMRGLWYVYYISFIGIPLFLFYNALFFSEKRSRKIIPIIIVSGVISLVLIGFVLTNDLHQLVFKFYDTFDESSYKYKYLYFLVFGWILVLFLSAYFILIRNCGVLMGKKYSWLVIVYGSLGWGLVALLSFTDIQTVVFNTNRPFKFTELYCAQSISFILTCIRLWLIPADKDYNRLNDAIEEVNEQLKEESELTRLQNELKKEQLETEQKNRLYDEIAQSVSYESEQILKLTKQSNSLPTVCVYGAYIKRIANLRLLASEQEYIPMGELVLSIREIGRYLDKTKIYVSLQGNSSGEISALGAVDILKILNYIICDNLSNLEGVSVTFSENKKSFLRATVEGKLSLSIESDISDTVVCSTVTEDDVAYITFGLVNGGDAV